MEAKFDNIIEDQSDSVNIALKIDNIIKSFQEIDRVIEQLVAETKASAPSCT